MSRFSRWRKIPPVLNAVQWFKNGDHPLDGNGKILVERSDGTKESVPVEGKVVRYFRHPRVKGSDTCKVCGHLSLDHGWIDNTTIDPTAPVYRTTVCPGDWVISRPFNQYEAVNPATFLRDYERAP